MKMVLCGEYGGGIKCAADCKFEYEWLKKHGFDLNQHGNLRNNSELISLLEQMKKENPNHYFNLSVHEVPDEATDWEIQEYDGAEECVIYVLNGKICRT